MTINLSDTSRLCVHTITTKPLNLEQAAESYVNAGVRGITVWRDALENRNPVSAGNMLVNAGLQVVSLCRGGFFPATSKAERQKAVEDNIRACEEAAAIGAPLVVLVCGAVPGQPLAVSREQIQRGIEATLPRARELGIKLAVEPLHPMYADSRSAINTLKQANDLCDNIGEPDVGITVDVYHLWWDPELESEIARCGAAGRLFSFHICDWKTPTTDLLNDRGLMGEGCIPLRQIRGWVEKAGFRGFHEVEIFSHYWWRQDQGMFLQKIRESYLAYC